MSRTGLPGRTGKAGPWRPGRQRAEGQAAAPGSGPSCCRTGFTPPSDARFVGKQAFRTDPQIRACRPRLQTARKQSVGTHMSQQLPSVRLVSLLCTGLSWPHEAGRVPAPPSFLSCKLFPRPGPPRNCSPVSVPADWSVPFRTSVAEAVTEQAPLVSEVFHSRTF